jgi:plasmid stabilization system protein ParE
LSAYRVVFSRRSRDQLDRIGDYLSVHVDEETAEGFVSALVDRCLELATFPDRGTSHEELGKSVRTRVNTPMWRLVAYGPLGARWVTDTDMVPT